MRAGAGGGYQRWGKGTSVVFSMIKLLFLKWDLDFKILLKSQESHHTYGIF